MNPWERFHNEFNALVEEEGRYRPTTKVAAEIGSMGASSMRRVWRNSGRGRSIALPTESLCKHALKWDRRRKQALHFWLASGNVTLTFIGSIALFADLRSHKSKHILLYIGGWRLHRPFVRSLCYILCSAILENRSTTWRCPARDPRSKVSPQMTAMKSGRAKQATLRWWCQPPRRRRIAQNPEIRPVPSADRNRIMKPRGQWRRS